jgi:hypothetical protein
MPDSVRQRIFDAVGTRAATILVANGYQTDIGSRLTKWNTTPITERELDGVDLRDASETSEPQVNRHQDRTLIVDFEVHAKKGAATAAFLRKAIADIEQMIGVDRAFGNLAKRTVPRGNEMIIDKTDRTVGGVQVKFAIEYRTLTLDPYNQ